MKRLLIIISIFMVFMIGYGKTLDVNVVVVFISNKTSLLNTKQYVENNNFTFPVYYDFDKSILKGFKVKNVPFNLKIRNSVIEESSSTIMNYDDFNKLFSN